MLVSGDAFEILSVFMLWRFEYKKERNFILGMILTTGFSKLIFCTELIN